MIGNELTFANKEAAFKVAELLLEECYVVMLSREEELYILNFEYSENCDRNDVVFMSEEQYEENLQGWDRSLCAVDLVAVKE